jgi:hypothetical protein
MRLSIRSLLRFVAAAGASTVFALASAVAAGAEELARRELLDGRVSLLVPTSFELMSDEHLRTKYPSENRPAFVLTDASGLVNVAAGHTNFAISPEQLVAAHRGIEQSVRSQVPSAVWHRSEVLSKNGQPYLLLAHRSPGIDYDVENIMYVASVDGRLLTISFNCPANGEQQWLQHGQDIIDSIVVAE